MLIRRATGQDADAVREVGSATWPGTYAFAGADYVADGLQQWWSAEAVARSIRDCITLIAAEQDAAVGMATVDLRTDPPTMWKLYVLPSWHGRGVGSQLLDAVLAELPAGTPALRLDVTVGNEHAVSFYRRRGFVDTGEEQPPDRPDWPPTRWMRLELT